MTKRRIRNTRLTSEKERRKQYIIKSVVKRGRRVTWRSISRWTVRVVKILLLASVIGGVYWGATEGYRRLFWENPDYALKNVEFRTDGSMTREQAITVAGFVAGRNIFSYKLDAARDALLALPQVEDAELRRYLPDRIEVTVTERRPVAWVTSGPSIEPGAVRTRLIDARGLVFQPKRTRPEYDPLPMIYGVPLEDFAPGKSVQVAEVVVALELLRKVRETGEFQITTMDLSKGYCIEVIDQKGTQVTFGLDDLDSQLWRLAQVRNEAGLRGQDLETVNVMVSRNIPVTFRPPPAPEPDLDELLREPSSKDAPRAKPIGAEPPARAKSTPKKAEPIKPKEPAPRENEPLLRPFRRV